MIYNTSLITSFNLDNFISIINVTAVEGKFKSEKNGKHPHTNMCKAAINMMILTMAAENEEGISPNQEHFPLSSDEGGSRVVDQIISHFNGKSLKSGYMWKNYKLSNWCFSLNSGMALKNLFSH